MTDRAELARDAQQFDALLDHVHGRVLEERTLPTDDAQVVAVAFALLRSIAAQGEALALVSRTPVADTTSANLRTMFEGWAELRYLLTQGSSRDNAVRYRVFGLLEMRDFVASEIGNGQDIDAVDRRVAALRAKYPVIVRTVESERAEKRPPMYWSGKTRRGLLQALDLPNDSGNLVRLYKVLSWDAHQIMTGVLDVDVREDGKDAELLFGPRQEPAEAAEFARALGFRILADAWNAVATHFNFDA